MSGVRITSHGLGDVIEGDEAGLRWLRDLLDAAIAGTAQENQRDGLTLIVRLDQSHRHGGGQ